MKKNIIIPIIAALMSIVVAVGAALAVRHLQYGMWYKCETVHGFESSNYKGRELEFYYEIITNKKDLDALQSALTGEKYDSDFFTFKSLIIIQTLIASNKAYDLVDIYRNGNKLIVEVEFRYVLSPTVSNYFSQMQIEVQKMDLIGIDKIIIQKRQAEKEE